MFCVCVYCEYLLTDLLAKQGSFGVFWVVVRLYNGLNKTFPYLTMLMSVVPYVRSACKTDKFTAGDDPY